MPIPILVDCQWPCPGGNACILNETSISCQPKQNSQWIWTDPNQSPQYDGEPARLHQPCITIPLLHHLPIQATSNPNSTMVNWPPTDPAHPVDRYLSDCNQATFCDQGSCVPKLGPGEPCDSTHQCQNGICQKEKCELIQQEQPPEVLAPQHQQKQTEGDSPWSNQSTFTTGHIVGVILAGVVLIIAILVFFYCYRQRKQRVIASHHKSMEEAEVVPLPPITLSSDPTPSVQQQQLQFQLQRQLPSGSTHGPPPYSP
ncbi:hypothetical protein BC941DRAFT_507580 [Chlamydoabsidia padenii]|nr:hypothetical protein BC941DRAFT_507580 [Chlamydoabsidia padenii]